MTFKRYPPRLIVEMVNSHVFWLNSFPHCDHVHTPINPRKDNTNITTRTVKSDLVNICKYILNTTIP